MSTKKAPQSFARPRGKLQNYLTGIWDEKGLSQNMMFSLYNPVLFIFSFQEQLKIVCRLVEIFDTLCRLRFLVQNEAGRT